MIRTFVAIELEASLRQALAQVQATLRSRLEKSVGSGARIHWVKPESIHLTLKFLGDVPEALVPKVQTALAGATGKHKRFAAEVRGLGVFPDIRTPHVLWVGMATHADELKQLAADVEAALGTIGFAPEAKPFSPHLTLARIKERSRDIGRALSGEGMLTHEIKFGELTVAAVSLMKSDLQRSGSVYTCLRAVPLKEA
jgi:RNA 2',3'-cyclic 3'-phosphodiesterase